MLTGPQLFQSCAAHPSSDEYWPEFVRRYNPLLVRSIVIAWRRYGSGDWPPPDLALDLLQDVYLAIVNKEFRLLRKFRGETEAEAEAYLAHTAINKTISFLRARSALRRAAEEISLQDLIGAEGEGRLPLHPSKLPLKLTEGELIETIERCFDGPNGNRDALIFLLYARDGYSAAEIAAMGICGLKESSIANLLGQMKARLRKYFTGTV